MEIVVDLCCGYVIMYLNQMRDYVESINKTGEIYV